MAGITLRPPFGALSRNYTYRPLGEQKLSSLVVYLILCLPCPAICIKNPLRISMLSSSFSSLHFLNYRQKAKAAEGRSNVGAIRTTEIAFFAEWDYYVCYQTPVPVADRAFNADKEPWGNAGGVSKFSLLGWAPEGKVYFSYGLCCTWTGHTHTECGHLSRENWTQAQVQASINVFQGCAIKAFNDLDEDGAFKVYNFNVGAYAGGTTSDEIEY